MSVESVSTWFLVNVVHKDTGKVIRTDIDAVMANGVSDAVKAAMHRNPLKPWESFGVKKASGLQKRRCCKVNEDRTRDIAEFIELMSD